MLFTIVQDLLLSPSSDTYSQHFWVDTLDPWAIHITTHFGIRWYGLAYAVGFSLTYCVYLYLTKVRFLPLNRDQISELFLWFGFSCLIGGRLGESLLYKFPETVHHPWLLLNPFVGGMSVHGAVPAVVMALVLFARKYRVDAWLILDPVFICGGAGLFFGRIANFVNGELWGRPSSVPWAVIFPHSPLIAGLSVPRHPSQLYGAVLEGLIVFGITTWALRQERRSGVAFSTGIFAYGALRFIEELWREPDPSRPLYFGWLTWGQTLCVPMVFAGACLLIWRSVRGNKLSEAQLQSI